MQRQEQNSRCHCDRARKTLHLECPAQHCHSNTVHTIVSPRAGEQALTRCAASHYSKYSEHAQHEPEPPCRARLLAATVAVEPSGTDAGCAHRTARGALITHRAGARAFLGGQSTGSTEPTRGTRELQGNSTHTHIHIHAHKPMSIGEQQTQAPQLQRYNRKPRTCTPWKQYVPGPHTACPVRW